MEAMEKELKLVKASLSKKRKEARLWKRRYEQERIARYAAVFVVSFGGWAFIKIICVFFPFRVAAEDQIQSLQKLVDQTFQQFALDDSDDDCEDDDGSLSPSEDSLEESSPLLITENGHDDEHSSIIPLNLETVHKDKISRHVRAQSSQ